LDIKIDNSNKLEETYNFLERAISATTWLHHVKYEYADMQDIFTIVIPAPDPQDFKTSNLFTKNKTRLHSTLHVSRSHKTMCTANQNNKWFWQNLNLRFAQPHVHRYVHVLSLCHLYPLLFTWRITNENFQKIFFSCNSSHNFTSKRNELRYPCWSSQLYFIGH
jgi:hypothetical protein